jgi:hypothetical protein
MFSARSVPKLYNVDLRQLELEFGRVLEMAVEGDWEEIARLFDFEMHHDSNYVKTSNNITQITDDKSYECT